MNSFFNFNLVPNKEFSSDLASQAWSKVDFEFMFWLRSQLIKNFHVLEAKHDRMTALNIAICNFVFIW